LGWWVGGGAVGPKWGNAVVKLTPKKSWASRGASPVASPPEGRVALMVWVHAVK
jgi:hypothetical protein